MIDLKLLANRASIKKFNTGSVIMDEYSKNADEIYILLIGQVELYKDYNLQHKILLDTISPGSMFGEINIYNESSNLYTAVAKQPTTVAYITRQTFLSLARKNNDLFIQIIEILCERISKTQNKVEILNLEKHKMIDTYGIDLESFYWSLLYPREHRSNYALRPDEYQQYIYHQEYTCPHCHQKFDDYTILSSKLIMNEELKCDLRRRYQSFEPIWYEILTCPQCYFSAYESYFTNKIELNNNSFADYLEIIHTGLKLNFEEPKNIEQVFASHYLALICAEGFENKKQLEARLWLSLYRLYGDIREDRIEKYAAQKAFDATQTYYSECDLSSDARQTLLMVMGTLLRKLGKIDEAVLFLSNAIRELPNKTVYKRLIEMEIDSIREQKKKSNK